jgi:hypothetical protein
MQQEPRIARQRSTSRTRKKRDIRHRRGALGELKQKQIDDAAVKLLARALEQRSIRRLFHQSVLERVGSVRRLATNEHNLRVDQSSKALAQYRLFEPCHGRKQRRRELPSEHCCPLRDLLRGREPVEPRHQRVGKRCGNHLDTVPQPWFDRRLGQLLHVKRS